MLVIKNTMSWLPALTLLISTHLAVASAIPPNMTAPAKPLNIGVLLFPAFQALDVFGPLDALNILSMSQPLNLHLLSATLDPVSTKPLSPAMNPLDSKFSESVVPTHTLASPPPRLDVLLVPGGLGTRAPGLDAHVDFIRAAYPGLQYLITVCTGAALAARAGVLDGKRATTNKRSWAATIAQGPGVEWVAKARWVVDGNVWTSSGISAGMDATLDWMGHVWGRDVAKEVADRMEYEWHEDPSWDPFADMYNLTSPAVGK